MNMLTKHIECDPEQCPIAEECPNGPMPGAPCHIKEQFLFQLDRTVSDTFKKLDDAPETRLRLDLLLRPLFEQLLLLKMGETQHRKLFHGKGINPIFREMRQCISAINNVLTETMRAYKEETADKPLKSAMSELLGGNGYYEMLCYDGQGSVEARVGPN